MKHVLSAILILLLNAGYTQSYTPLPEDSATWNHLVYVQGAPWTYWSHTLIGDTIIGTKTYNKVYETNNPLYQYYLAAIRNDTMNQRVYVVPKDSTDEYLNYDFNVSSGDTIYDYLGYQFMTPVGWIPISATQSITVIGVDSLLIGSEYRKRVALDNGFKWYEGIGSSKGLLSPIGGAHDNPWGWILWHCAEIYSTTYYHQNYNTVVVIPEACNMELSTPNADVPSVNIFPNPASDYLIIETNELSKVKIINAIGNVLIQTSLLVGENRVDISTLPNGYYFVKIGAMSYSLSKE